MSNSKDNPLQIDEGFDPRRERVNIVVGNLVTHQKTVYRIEQVMDFESVIGTAVETGRSTQLRVGELQPLNSDDRQTTVTQSDLADIADDD